MRGVYGMALAGVVAAVGIGVVLTWIAKARVDLDREYSKNNLRELGHFAALHAAPPKDPPPGGVPTAIPAGTIPNPNLPPESRLSWVVDLLPNLDQRRQPTGELVASLDRLAAWDAGPNRKAAETVLVGLVCPGNRPEVAPGSLGLTQYVGMAGIEPDAATLGLGPPIPDRAGCFRYDAPTPFADVLDGTSTTVLFAETNRDLGPWIRGGPSTVRGLDVSPTAVPAIGPGGQFGGIHPGGGLFGMADGSVRFLVDRASPEVLRALATIAGGPSDPIPGE